MTSVPFHACTSCKANIPPSDKHPLCVRCLGVQHAMDLCTVFQPRVCHNRLRRAMGLDAQSPTAEPSAAFGATSPPLQLSQSPSQEIPCAQDNLTRSCTHSPSPKLRRLKRSKQARDIIYLKEQMAQVLELLSRQQAPVAPVEAQAPISPAPASAPGSPMGAQVELELEPQPLMAEEDTIFSGLLG
ncbi:UNVERIFIED_CONTAM: hypothetical protein FKN15_062891 [Acipenser sinensis]